MNSFIRIGFISVALVSVCACSVASDNYENNITYVLDDKIKGFEIDTMQDIVTIRANSKINLNAGKGYYFKHLRGEHWSWNGNQYLSTLAPKKGVTRVPEQWDWRWGYNYCTLSYTSAFWGKEEWHKELELMALNGMTHLLVQAGLEKVWQLTLRELGYPEDKIIAFLPSSASAAWWNMGNLEGHGGPLTQGLIDREAELGRTIVQKMQSYGMTPVLQGFVGLVPHELKMAGKELPIVQQGRWCDGFMRPAVLDPTSDIFPTIAAIWYKNIEKVYGIKAAAFAGDLFHEGGQSKGINVTKAATAVQTAMQKASPGSCWVIQSWGGNPSRALMDGLDKDKCRVLMLCKNMTNSGADGSRVRPFFGSSWIWCELLNFGGNQGLYGSLKLLANLGNLQKHRDEDPLTGIGLLSEGTETNPMFYDLFFDRIWMDKTHNMTDAELEAWIKAYALRRYGCDAPEAVRALMLLNQSVYSPAREQEGCTESILCGRPDRNIRKASTWASGGMYYNPQDVLDALKAMIAAADANPELKHTITFRYDLADIGRQFLADLSRPLLAKAMKQYDRARADKSTANVAAFNATADQFTGLILATDKLLATHTLWRFGRMYAMAEAKGSTPAEKELMTFAAKQLVTTWSGKIGSLNDYAHRQLSGLMKDYYLQRWSYFFDAHRAVLAGSLPENQLVKNYRDKLHAFEPAWAKEPTRYSPTAEGDTYAEAVAVLKTFEPIAKELYREPKGADGMKWTLNDGAKVFKFNVTDAIDAAGTYTATFQWETGDSALVIKKVALYEGTKLVAEDNHRGQTGWKNDKNTYTLTVKQLRTNLDAYTLTAEVEGHSSNNSSGTLSFTK